VKIAVVGTGISGLTAAYLLHKDHDITVFEENDKIGGHTATIDVQHDGVDYAIDTGFIVYNDWTYPNFIKLMNKLGVSSLATEMSFSVKSESNGLEYSGSNLNTLFAQRKNLVNPGFIKMILDILRFNKESIKDLESGSIQPGTTLGEYLKSNNYSEEFANHYLIPMGSAIWSASTKTMFDFPLLFFVRFFKNHGLLSVNDRPQWRVIKGGSRSYLEPLTRDFKDRIKTGMGIKSVKREEGHVDIVTADGQSHRFDQVILACHSDQALSMLQDPTDSEKSVLGAMEYQDNDVVLHTDDSLLPKKKLAWASWNYWLRAQEQSRTVLTYDMNILQRIKAPVTFCVTLNATSEIDPSKILGRFNYSHPVFTLDSVAATERWEEINGVNNTWYCGAYWANGFHEDGVKSGIRVAKRLGAEWD